MGQAVPVRTDYTAGEVRRFARRAKDGAQARRLLAPAAVLDGASREEAPKIGGNGRSDTTSRGLTVSSTSLRQARRPSSTARKSRAHAVLILKQAGWHCAKDLKAPKNISLLPLPPRAPKLNPQEIFGNYAHVPQKVCSTSSCGEGGCAYLADWGWSSKGRASTLFNSWKAS